MRRTGAARRRPARSDVHQQAVRRRRGRDRRAGHGRALRRHALPRHLRPQATAAAAAVRGVVLAHRLHRRPADAGAGDAPARRCGDPGCAWTAFGVGVHDTPGGAAFCWSPDRWRCSPPMPAQPTTPTSRCCREPPRSSGHVAAHCSLPSPPASRSASRSSPGRAGCSASCPCASVSACTDAGATSCPALPPRPSPSPQRASTHRSTGSGTGTSTNSPGFVFASTEHRLRARARCGIDRRLRRVPPRC